MLRDSRFPGILSAFIVLGLSLILVAVAERVHWNLPSISIVAMLVGLVLGNLKPSSLITAPGSSLVIKSWLSLGVALLGAGLDLGDLDVGLLGLAVAVGSMAIAFFACLGAARLCGQSATTGVLLGAGTAICGNSAIIAIAPLTEANEEELVLSLGTINLAGLLAMLVLPLIAIKAQIDPSAAGIWAGLSIHAVPQAIAAGEAVSPDAMQMATLFKLARVALLVPMVIFVSWWLRRSSPQDEKRSRLKMPWFIWAFAALSLAKTIGFFAAFDGLVGLGDSAAFFNEIGRWILSLAMASIGLEVELKRLLKVGIGALSAGMIGAVVLAAGSLSLILFTGIGG